MDTPRFQVICLDGGGCKGLYSAGLLARIEKDHDIRVDEHFDLIVGTSTGALIACGLALGMRPRELVQLYRDKGHIIFPQSRWRKVAHWFRAKYDLKRLQAALREIYGDRTLSGCTRRLVVPAYWHNQDKPRLLKTPHNSRYFRDHSFLIRDVALASAAAPSYFSAVEPIDHGYFIDGGVWANNPVMVGLVEAITSLGQSLEDIAILSLGTSDPVRKYVPVHRKGGKLIWAREAVRVCMRGQSLCATNQARLLLGDRFMRIDPVVAENQFEIDRMDTQQLLSFAANDSLHRGQEIIDRFMGHVAPPFQPHNGKSKPSAANH